MIQVSEKASFYAHVVAERIAMWSVAPGVSFISRAEHCSWGIALHIDSRALMPQQMHDALERRFVQAHLFSDYFVFLNVQRDFVVWHAAPEFGGSMDDIRERELMLVGLGHLNH